jgi:ATP-dependent exoDNAse (exonuclease V) alpha subunit
VQDPRKEPPLAILVDFDHYDGLEYTRDPVTNRKLVPIFWSTRDFVRGSVTCTRSQFPLTKAYAITIHKSQGISVTKIVLNLTGKADFAPGLTYVAMSRVRSLKGLLIEEPFSLERLRFKATATIVMRNTDYERRKL